MSIDDEKLAEETLQQMRVSYKKELSQIYKMSTMQRKIAPSASTSKQYEKMRQDIEALKKKYNINY